MFTAAGYQEHCSKSIKILKQHEAGEEATAKKNLGFQERGLIVLF